MRQTFSMGRASAELLFCLSYTAFVIYGSLVPLDYRPMPLEQALAAFAHIPYLELGLASRADWVANGVLYLPLGFVVSRLLGERPGGGYGLGIAAAWVFSATLAIAVEFTQLYFPPRTVSQNDIIAECIGGALGAVLAPFLAGRLNRTAESWRQGSGRLVVHLLEAYALAYVALAFFPYDLLLSVSDLHEKINSNLWGWWLALQDRGLFFTLLSLGLDLALSVPIGVLLVTRNPRAVPGRARVAALGLALGAIIETGQFFVDSGVSQGASVLARAAGVVLGAAVAPRLAAGGLPWVRSQLRRAGPALVLAYVPLLLAANGLFGHRWQGWPHATAAWAGLRLLPFYYHYYTTEALALYSLGSVALMYLPIAALGWAWRWSGLATLAAMAAVALLMEAAKLFFAGLHADPTNVLIAVAAGAVALRMGALEGRSLRPAAPPAAAPQRRPAGWPVALLLLPIVAIWAARFPAFALPLVALLLLAAALAWWRPLLVLAIVPAALPVFDLAPWSGRFFVDEFDLLQAVCLAVAFQRTRRAEASHTWHPLTPAFALLALSLAVSALRPLWPLPTIDDNSFASYYSPFNALRILKGALWAWPFLQLWRRLAPEGPARSRTFAIGIRIGLALTVLCILWERLAFGGLFDFASDYRVTGPISAMHTGGAYIECWLAVAAAFAVNATLRERAAAGRIAGLVLLAATCYALMMTYARNGYIALVVAVVMVLAAWLLRPSASRGSGGWAAAVLAVIVGVATPIAMGSFALDRLAQSGRDLAVRQAHWADAMGLRDSGLVTNLFGMGLGRFPETHYWRSQEAAHAASYRLLREGRNTFLRLGAGATLYLEQLVAAELGDELVLKMDLRSKEPTATLALALCEKWLLTSKSCTTAQASVSGPAGSWRHAEVALHPVHSAGLPSAWRAPLKLALLTPSKDGIIDVDNLVLAGADGVNRLSNGDFSSGLDHWFFATDVDPPWHIHNLPLTVLFDQGWFGVFAWAVLLAAAIVAGVRRLRDDPVASPAYLAAAAAFLISGSLNTLIDAPRFLFLLLVLLGAGATDEAAPVGTVKSAVRPTAPG